MTGPTELTRAYRELLGNGSLYTFATAFQISASIVAVPIVTRILTAESFGEIALVLVIIQIGGIAGGFGIPAAITRLHFDGTDGARTAPGLTWLAAGLSVALSIIIDFTGPSWSAVLGIDNYPSSFRLAVWTIPAMVIARAAQAVFRARGEAVRFVAVAGLLSLGANLAGLLAVIITPTALAFVTGMAVGSALAAITGIFLMGLARSPGGSASRIALALGIPTVAHGLAMYAMSAGDRLVIQSLEGLGEVGRYQPAYLAGSLGVSLLIGLNNAWAPLIHGANEKSRWELLSDTSATVTRIGALVAIVLAMVAPLTLNILVPSSYDPNQLADIAAVVAGSCVPYAVYLSAVHILFQEKRTLALGVITPLGAGLNIGLNFFLIGRLGLMGAALSTVASYIALAAMIHVQSRRIHLVKWHWRVVAQWTGLAGVSITMAVLAPSSLGWTLLRVGLAVSAGIYLLVMTRELVGSSSRHGVSG